MRRKWSKEKIVELIKSFKKENVDLSAGNISKNHITLFTAACSKRYFSSWAAAVQAAGIDYDAILEEGKARRRAKLVKWTRESILKKILGFRPENLLAVYQKHLGLYSAARREFGSWKRALEAAGYTLSKGSYKNSNRIFLKQTKVAEEYGPSDGTQKKDG